MGDWNSEKESHGEYEAKSAIVVGVEIARGWSGACTCRANGVRKCRAATLKLG